MFGMVVATAAPAQEILPFPPAPSASTAGLTMEDSTYKKRVEPQAPRRRRAEHPDHPDGRRRARARRRPTAARSTRRRSTASRRWGSRTTASTPRRCARRRARRCSPGAITPSSATARSRRSPTTSTASAGRSRRSSATVAEVLKDYGYNTGAWGKWHNTPEEQITSKGPFDYWPTGYGFEYFYGFLAGEASQYEPTLTRNTTPVTEEKPKGYHLTEDIAEDAIHWLREQKAYAPDKPFFMYWAPGASHGPHQVMKEWADKYKGKFDDGWDKYRERTFARAKAKGWIPQDAQLTPRPGVDGVVGFDPRRREAVPAPPDGGVRRLHRARRLQRRPRHRRDRAAGQARQHADLLHLGRQRLLVGGPERHHQRAARAERHPDQDLAAPRGAEGTRRPRRARRPEDRQHVPRRLGLGGQHALPGHQADGRLFRRHPPADGRVLAEAHQGGSRRRGRSSTT